MPRQKPLVLVALQLEAAKLREAAERAGAELMVIGPRARRLPDNLASDRPPGIIVAGIAGGLDPSLVCGDVIVDELSTFDTSHLALRVGTILTVEEVVSTCDQKRRAFESTSAHIVDMENAIVRQRCEDCGIPFVGIRAVSDTAFESLDAMLFDLVDEEGDPRIGAAINALVRRPTFMMDVLRARAGANAALDRLARVLPYLIKAMHPSASPYSG